jgi:SAM-dependent methyltransferase
MEGDHMGHIHGTMPAHMGLFGNNAKDDAYDFGWGFGWKWGFFIGWVVFLAMAVGVFIMNSSLYILTAILLLIALQLYVVDIAIRKINKMDSELVLPYVDLLKSDKDVILDAGCGHGRTTIAMSKVMKNGRIVAIDRFDAGYIADGGRKLLERNLKIAKIGDRVDIQAQDVTAMTFGDGTFDAAVSSYMIDHLGNNKLKGLREINRVLKKDGRFLLMVVTPNFFTRAITVISFFHMMVTRVEEWDRLFEDSGFKCTSDGDINLGHYFLLEKKN